MLVVAILVAALHLLALEYYLYWTLWWFDMLLHLLGGVWVSFTTFWLLYIARLVPHIPQHVFSMVIAFVVATLIVGVGWEVVEHSAGVIERPSYGRDTTIDIIMDVVGALLAALYILKSQFRAVLQ